MEIKGFRKCDGCFTAKVVMGLGMVEMKCPNCNGVGYIKDVDDELAYLEEMKEKSVLQTFPESDVIVGFKDKPAVFASTGENVIDMNNKKNFKSKSEKLKRE